MNRMSPWSEEGAVGQGIEGRGTGCSSLGDNESQGLGLGLCPGRVQSQQRFVSK